jgi:hypothetical protein
MAGWIKMNLLDLVVEIMTPFILCFLAYPILERFSWFRKFGWAEKVLASLVASLTIILFPLYFVGVVIGNFFVEASRFLFVAGLVLIIAKLIHVLIKLLYAHEFKIRIKRLLTVEMSLINFALIVSVVFFVANYTFFLVIKAIIDWDVASLYLPLARAICTQNLIPLTDQGLHNIGQQGISILYGLVYSNSSSLVTENFRFMPLAFILVTFVLVFSIAKLFLNGSVAKLAVIVCCFLPIFDSSLSWFSFYPDLAFATLAVALFYFLFRYIKTGATVFGALAGLAFGLSSFMKPMSFWLFPVIIFAVLPLVKKRSIRLIITFLTPFAILLGALPLSFIGMSSAVFWSELSTVFAYGRIPYIISLVFLTILIIISNELGAKASVLWPKQNAFKPLMLILGISVPFYLIWYLRNYLSFGTFIWAATVNNPNYQWALAIIQKTIPPTSSPPGEFYLFNLLVLLTLPALGTAFLLPKIVGAVRLVRRNKESSFLYTWTIGYFLMYFLFIGFNINERYMLPIMPFIAIFSAAGIFYIVSYLKKSPNVDIMVLFCMFLGLFLVVQSRVIFELGQSYTGFFANTLLRIVDVLNVPRSVLAGSGLSIANFGSPSLNLLYFGSVVSIVAVVLILVVSINMGNLRINLRTRVIKIPLRKCLYFASVLLIALLVLVTPYVSLVYNFSGGDVSTFQDKERLKYGFGSLYSVVLPYLKANISKSDVILTVNTYATGLQYYLEDSRIIDLYTAENLAAMRDIVESNNISKTFSALQIANVRYVLVPSNVLTIVPFLSDFLNPILTSKYVELTSTSLTTGSRTFFKQVISGGWNLYELQANNIVKGSGAIVTVLQDNTTSTQQTQTFYYDASNVTSYLRLFGHTNYSLTDIPPYLIFKAVTPTPSSITLDTNQWINFTGSSDINYTVYWSNLNYQRIGWKDDSFLNGWVPIGAANFSTNGDIARIMAPKNQTWTGIQRVLDLPVNLQQFSRFIVEITEINGSVVFSGIVDGQQQYLGSSAWISSPGTYVFDVSNVGTSLTQILIYLDSETNVNINYVMFAAKT